jgi:hypothetical protein
VEQHADDPDHPTDRSSSPGTTSATVEPEAARVPAPRESDDRAAPAGPGKSAGGRNPAATPHDAGATAEETVVGSTAEPVVDPAADTGGRAHPDVDGDVGDDRIDGLELRLRHLEDLLWGDVEDQRAEFGLSDPELVTLAKAAEYAQALSRMLVTPRLRAGCERAIEECRAWQRHHDQTLDVALEASRAIATTNPEQERHQEAARRFASARAELDALEPDRRRVRNSAQHARRQLAHDQEIRERYQREIGEGHRAWATLTSRLRVRASVAVERAEPLPVWLVESLGVPPSSGAAGWRDLTVQLLAYRITYAVTDPHQALGDEPGSAESPRRRQWYRDLVRELRDWRDATTRL